MTSSPKSSSKIIRQANVEGIVFCTPTGEIEQEMRKQQQEQEHLKTLEEFWLDKGFQKGLDKGFQEGVKKGVEEGFIKGLAEGRAACQQEMEQQYAKKGLEEGYQQVKQDLQSLFTVLADAIQQFAIEKESTIDKLKPQLVTLSFMVAEKILCRELDSHTLFTKLIDQLLQQYKQAVKQQHVTIVLSPQLLEALHKWCQQNTLKEIHGLDSVHFTSDDNLTHPNFRIEIPDGIVHFNMKRQLEELQHKVLEKEMEADETTE